VSEQTTIRLPWFCLGCGARIEPGPGQRGHAPGDCLRVERDALAARVRDLEAAPWPSGTGECGHDKYWTKHYGGCMACERDALSSKVKKLEAERESMHDECNRVTKERNDLERASPATVRGAEVWRLRDRLAMAEAVLREFAKTRCCCPDGADYEYACACCHADAEVASAYFDVHRAKEPPP